MKYSDEFNIRFNTNTMSKAMKLVAGLNFNLNTAPMNKAMESIAGLNFNLNTAPMSKAMESIAGLNFNLNTAPMSKAMKLVAGLNFNLNTVPMSKAMESIAGLNFNLNTAPMNKAMESIAGLNLDFNITSISRSFKALNSIDYILNIDKISSVFIENDIYTNVQTTFNTVKEEIDIETKTAIENQLSGYQKNEIKLNKFNTTDIKTFFVTILFTLFIALQINNTADKSLDLFISDENNIADTISFPIREGFDYINYYTIFQLIKYYINKDNETE